MSAPFYADLHTHTTLSDGNDTPCELLLAAAAAGLGAVGLTDHDVLPPAFIWAEGKRVSPGEYAASLGLCVLPGVEFSCQTYVEDVHIIAFGCDFTAAPLRRLEEEVRRSKANAYAELLRRLAVRGMPIAMEELLAQHENLTADKLQKKQIFDMMAKKGYAPTWKDAKLLVRQSPELAIKREKPDATRVLAAIREAGGQSILAHPFLIDEAFDYNGARVTRWAFIELLIEAGLQGIEGRYPYAKTTCVDKRPDDVLCGEIASRYAGRLCLSAGSDYHNDAKKGTTNARALGECGLTRAEFEAAGWRADCKL